MSLNLHIIIIGDDSTMFLSMANIGDEVYIKQIKGRPDTRQFLESLGFVAGSMVRVVSFMGGNLIVQVKESRVAISREMATKILI